MLERWRERDVFHESSAGAGGAPVGLLRGPADGQRAARLPSRARRACSRTSSRATGRCAGITSSARAAGTATACRSSGGRGSSGSSPRPTSSPTDRRVQCALPRDGPQPRRGLEPADRADRVLDRPRDAYRTLDPSYIESVWWALKTIHEQGLLYEAQGRPLLPPLRHRAVEPRVAAGGYRDVSDPSVYVRLPVDRAPPAAERGTSCSCGRRRRGRSSPTRPWRSTPSSTYVRARADDGRVAVLAAALVERVLGEGAEVLTRFPGSELLGTAYVPPFRFIPARPTARRAIRSAGRLRHGRGRHRPRAHCDRVRRGRLPPRRAAGLNVVNPVRLDGTYDERIGPYAGRWVKDADPDLIEELREPRPAAAGRELRARLPALLALRDAAALLRQAVLVHRHEPDQGSAAGRQRDGQLASRAHQARPLRRLAGGQRRLGALARALLGHAVAGVALREATST